MPLLANVIVPAFALFYLAFLHPLVWAIILVSEFAVIFLRHRRDITAGKIAIFVICANILSAICGAILSAFLPSGFAPEFVRKGVYVPQPGPNYELLILSAFPLAMVLSWIIESCVMIPLIASTVRRRFVMSCLYANVASYAVLFALYIFVL